MRKIIVDKKSKIQIVFTLILLCAVRSYATTTLVQSNSNSTAAGVSHTVALSSTVTAGNLLIVPFMFGANKANCTYAVSDTLGNTWTQHPSGATDDTSASDSVIIFWTKTGSGGASDTATITVTGGSCGGGTDHTVRAGIFEYSATNGWPASPVDTSSAGNAGGSAATTGNAPNVTPSATGELIFSALVTGGTITSGTFTVSGTGFTREDAGGTAGTGFASANRIEGCDNTSSGNTATTCTFTWTSTEFWGAETIVFQPNTGSTYHPPGHGFWF